MGAFSTGIAFGESGPRKDTRVAPLAAPLSRRGFVAISVGSLAGLVLSGCSTQGASSKAIEKKANGKLVVHLGDQPSYFVPKVADRKGFFKKEFEKDGIEIKVDNFVNQGSAIIEAMKAGNLPIGVIGALPTISADASGSKFKFIASVNYSVDGFRLYASKQSKVTKVADLKGKTVGVKFSSSEHQMVLTLLSNNGLSPKDVHVVNMSAEDCLSSVLSGKADAALLRSEQIKPAEDGGAVELATNKETGLIVSYLVATEQFLKEHGDVAVRIIRVMYDTCRWMYQHEDEAIKIFAEETKTDEASARVGFDSRKRGVSVREEVLRDTVQQSIDFSIDQKLIAKRVDIDDVVDSSYFNQAKVKDDE